MDTKVISTGIRYSSLPESYVRPESERPNLSAVEDCVDVPIIDLGSGDREAIVQQIGYACSLFGFFQVINHGIPAEATQQILDVANEFFSLSVEEKMKLYSDDPSKTMRPSTSFNVKKETVHNWKDYLRLHYYPLDKYVPEWPSNPPFFKCVNEFFNLSVEEKMKLYSDEPPKTMRVSTSLNVKKETVHNWKDYLRLHCYPLDKYMPEWPSNPSSFEKSTQVQTPSIIQIVVQESPVRKMKRQLDEYRMMEGQNIREHIITVCDMMQELISAGYKELWTQEAQYQSLFTTLLPQDKELITSIRKYSGINLCVTLCFFFNKYRRREIVMTLYPSSLPVDIISYIADMTLEVISDDVFHAIPRYYKLYC
ncbi:protein DOWNY MILDEW RESISTANCE 6-like isoform X1 [Diospyros lotus]|uniref:protein DOWNY MILDEW RESISTANCE 6-like isoform X1 n=1 Tax=Diospyros lotus TaxID=55363 RepID=UPI00225AB64C|nr:protein DOWNY MILDEW RESISTANCE 6-like isoform X1 [Diospyros lotus]